MSTESSPSMPMSRRSQIELAMCCSKSAQSSLEIAKEYKISVWRRKSIQVHFKDGSQFNWIFVKEDGRYKKEWFQTRSIDDVEINIRAYGDDLFGLVRDDDKHSVEQMTKALEHLNRLYPGNVTEIRIPLKENDDEFNRIYRRFVEQFGSCQSLIVAGLADKTSLDLMLESIVVTRKLELRLFDPLRLDNPKLYDMKVLIVGERAWVTAEHLCLFNCEYLWLKQTELTKEEIKLFLRRVLAGETKNRMGFWKIEIDESWTEQDSRDVMATGRAWDIEQRDGFYTYNMDNLIEYVDCQSAVDFYRPEDDFLMSLSALSGTIYIIVWNTRRVMAESLEKHRKAVPYLVEKVRQRNLKRLRNSQLMLANDTEIDGLRQEISELGKQIDELREEFAPIEKHLAQIERLKGNAPPDSDRDSYLLEIMN